MPYFHVTADAWDLGLVYAADAQHARDRVCQLLGYHHEAEVVAATGAPSTLRAQPQSTIVYRGRRVPFQAVLEQMHCELSARVYARLAPCSAQSLVNAYVREHARIFRQRPAFNYRNRAVNPPNPESRMR